MTRTVDAQTSGTQLEHQLCRLCAEPRPKDSLVGIYEPEGQKLAIQTKMTNCLDIQICADDCLPLFVCFDCCIILNQCSEFYEKTNKAQYSLREILLGQKIQVQQALHDQRVAVSTNDLESNFILADSVTNFDKGNDDLCKLNGEIDKNCFKGVIDDLEKKNKIQDETVNAKEQETVVAEKKILLKNCKKKVKQKNNFLDINESDLQDFLSNELDKVSDKITSVQIEDSNKYCESISDKNAKVDTEHSNTKALINSEHEIILESADQTEPKVNQKKKEKLDQYPWLCTDCNDKLPSLEALEEHHETIHNQKAKYMCVQCCKVYEKYYGFLTHVKRHKAKAKYSCQDCGKTFVHKKVLETHRTVHREERPHVCQTCGKAFKGHSQLYIHSRCHLPEDMRNRFPCDQCDKRFSTKPNLVTHKRIHSGVRNFTCDQCGKSFVQKGNLEAHFLTHSAEKPYNCSQCSKAFKTPLQLKKHESVHTGAKPHECVVCGKTFREKGTLREHQRIHTGAMPFSCEFCGKHFRFKGILTVHRRQHTGEKPYSCVECQHHFTNWPNYNKHMKRRHGINTSKQALPQTPALTTSQTLSCNDSSQTTLLSPQIPPTIVQVVQTVPRVSETTQPIVLQALSSNAFAESTEAPATVVSVHHYYHQSNASIQSMSASSSAYFNATDTTPSSAFLPTNLSYNFYSIPNVVEPDLIIPDKH